MSIPPFPPGPYYTISWPGFLTSRWRVFITCKQAGKQALSRFTGAPSLITNMRKYVFRSKISGLPSRPRQSSVFLSENIQANTCTKGAHAASRLLYAKGERGHMCANGAWHSYRRGFSGVRLRVYWHARSHFLSSWSVRRADHSIRLQWNTY